MQLIFVSGLSGSGKTVALHMLEDMGFNCIDNVPAVLLGDLVEHALTTDDPGFERTAVGIDARNSATGIAEIPKLFEALRSRKVPFEVLFMRASNRVLLNRFSETRRKHPLGRGGGSLDESIEREIALLEPISRNADYIVDTSHTSVHELRELIRARVTRGGQIGAKMTLQFESFGFKHGIPGNADFVFDVRCLPNPYWEKSLRAHTGLDQPVIEFLEGQADVEAMFASIRDLLAQWIPRFSATNRSYLTVAIGCTGGQHRSVYLAERLCRHFESEHPDVVCRHTALSQA